MTNWAHRPGFVTDVLFWWRQVVLADVHTESHTKARRSVKIWYGNHMYLGWHQSCPLPALSMSPVTLLLQDVSISLCGGIYFSYVLSEADISLVNLLLYDGITSSINNVCGSFRCFWIQQRLQWCSWHGWCCLVKNQVRITWLRVTCEENWGLVRICFRLLLTS